MKGIILLLSICIAYASASEGINTDEGVLVLTTDTYDKAITENQYVLVEFYAPWCGHCKALAPEYVKAAKKLEEIKSEIKLAKVDATQESDLAVKNDIKGYPTLKFFRGGKAIDYTGGRTSEEIVNWLLKKTGPAAKTLTTSDEVKSFIEDGEVVVVGFFKSEDSDAAKEFISVAGGVDDYPFAVVTDDAIHTEHEVTGDTVVLFKKFDEGRHELTKDLNEDEITNFVKTNALPLIVDFNHETAQKVFGGDIKSHILMFLSKEAGHYDKYLPIQKKSAAENRGKLLFVTINTDDEDHGRILEFFGMKKDEIPAARAIRLAEEMAKFKPTTDVLGDSSEMNKFLNDFLEGKLKQHLLSQELPEDWDKQPVKILVASNFDEVAFDPEKSVLVEFYAPWCGHCKQLAPIYDKLGEKFADDKSVVIAKIDATINELEHTKINSFPTIKYYKKGDNKVIEYTGERTLEGLSRFIESDGEYGQAAPNEVAVDYTGARTLEGMSDYLLGKEPVEEPKEAEAEKEVEEEPEQAEEEEEDDDAGKRVEL